MVIVVVGSLFITQGSLKVSDLVIYALYINIFINPIDLKDRTTIVIAHRLSAIRNSNSRGLYKEQPRISREVLMSRKDDSLLKKMINGFMIESSSEQPMFVKF